MASVQNKSSSGFTTHPTGVYEVIKPDDIAVAVQLVC